MGDRLGDPKSQAQPGRDPTDGLPDLTGNLHQKRMGDQKPGPQNWSRRKRPKMVQKGQKTTKRLAYPKLGQSAQHKSLGGSPVNAKKRQQYSQPPANKTT